MSERFEDRRRAEREERLMRIRVMIAMHAAENGGPEERAAAEMRLAQYELMGGDVG